MTKPGAFVTVNAIFITAAPDGSFSASVDLEEGPNTIDVIASDQTGAMVSTILTVDYIP